MKKIYSLVLMAAMLLVGTSAWATTRTASSADELIAAWEATEDGDVIQLTNDITFTKTLWLGTSKMDDASKSITLDLNGWTLENKAKIRDMFLITHGELNIKTSVPGGQIIQDGPIGRNSTSGKNTPCNEQLFLVTGSTYKNVNPKTATEGYYSHLVIGAGVTVEAKKQNAIVIDEIANQQLYAAKVTDYYDDAPLVATAGVSVPNSRTAPYSTKAYTYVYTNSSNKDVYGTKGLANGVRIDIYGNVKAEKYAFKANGNLGSPSGMLLNNVKYDKTKDGSQNSPITIEDAPGSNTYEIQSTDIDYSPFIRIYGSADLRVPASNDKSKKPVAVYCSGYARWLIEGTCVGSTAVYVKSGEIDINDATIQSNYTGDYVPASATNSGVTASGSAIVIESNAAYSGDIDVTVSGDSKVTATNGYAIDEAVTSADETEVNAITIAGGTFEGGNVGTSENPEQGTIQISEKTQEANENPAQETTITVVGGEINGEVAVGNEGGLNDIVDNSSSYVTAVTDPGSGKTTLVVSTGTAPTPVANNFEIDNFTTGDVDLSDGALTNKDQVFDGATTKITIGTLKINPADDPVTLTIATGHTVQADKVILGYKGQIVVEAGAALVVTGNQGITAPTVDNIVLKTTETDQATFLFDPDVQSNRHPNATVEMLAKEIGKVSDGEHWHRFALPVEKTAGWTKAGRAEIASSGYPTYLFKWDYSADNWAALATPNDMKSFTGYTLRLASELIDGLATLEDVTYTFNGALAGNANSALDFSRNGYNFFGNSYSGHIDVLSLVDQIMGDAKIDGTMYVWDPSAQIYKSVPLKLVSENASMRTIYKNQGLLEIAPMHTFILKQNGAATASTELNYANSIWGNPRYDALLGRSSAPARYIDQDETMMVAVITAANGQSDNVVFVEDEQLSNAYDKGYDAAKYMNEKSINAYSTIEGEDLSVAATDNLEGATISFNTNNEAVYTLSFNNVNGKSYAVRDNVTGKTMAITEGMEYTFAAQPNTKVNGRFEIVSLEKVATAIDNTAVNAGVKGIYTILGQYVGENFDVLPAGVYVVDGVKVVK